jgi:hypothetical protein
MALHKQSFATHGPEVSSFYSAVQMPPKSDFKSLNTHAADTRLESGSDSTSNDCVLQPVEQQLCMTLQ